MSSLVSDPESRLNAAWAYEPLAGFYDEMPEAGGGNPPALETAAGGAESDWARSLGLPARYISGYLRSNAKTPGGEASHAWCSLFCPEFGWVEFDPTNDAMPAGNHVTITYGRDYSDVAPVMGVTLGGREQLIYVSVQVLLPATPPGKR